MIELFFEKSSLTNSEVIQLLMVKFYLTLHYLMLELQLNWQFLKRELYYYFREQINHYPFLYRLICLVNTGLYQSFECVQMKKIRCHSPFVYIESGGALIYRWFGALGLHMNKDPVCSVVIKLY
jgi:hypothetical protein